MEVFGPTHNVIHDDFCVGIVANGNTLLFGVVLPHAVNVMDEINEGCQPICWSKGHNGVSPLDCIHTLKSNFFLTQFLISQLMISNRRIEHPHPFPVSNSLKTAESHRGMGYAIRRGMLFRGM